LVWCAVLEAVDDGGSVRRHYARRELAWVRGRGRGRGRGSVRFSR